VPSNRVPMVISLIPADQPKPEAGQTTESLMSMTFPLTGSPYHYKVEPLLSPLGSPCSEPPWAALTAVDMEKREILWEVPLGSIDKMLPVSLPWDVDLSLGTPGAGGPLLTAGGLVFIGYTLDDRFRAFDLKSGEVVWQTDLPAAGTAVPVSYEAGGEQYIVIPAGGHTMYQTTVGDSVMAYKLQP
jgi:quinoprotein glucose dehydrogenase